ncbi:Flagellar FliJ protein [Rubripirellula lacrimiformis]|uniref:Flagellar FliJ protein n=2 Tax=Rubripirellula lacrimiformis TaxID=1930273 RepID=A0A517N6H4_9BACT|nr:Flagellar FliJ protein [Rubripirellula lacrimiformis]
MDLRRRQRDEAGAAVGKANQAIAKIDQQSDEVRRLQQEIRDQTASGRVGEVAVERLLSTGRYEMQLQADLVQLQETRNELVRERDRRQAALVEAEAEVKRFERLESNERDFYQSEMRRHEQADADERSNQAYILARRKPAT